MISYAGTWLTVATEGLDAELQAMLDPSWVFRVMGEMARPSQNLSWLASRIQPHHGPYRIGSLYWPQGASRFALGHYLVSEAQLSAIRSYVYGTASGFRAADLVMKDGVTTVTAAGMYMLPARPLQRINRQTPGLYLLTLVDDRFFWWFKSGTLSVTAGTTTWAQLYASIATLLGITLTADTVDSDYLKPPADFATSYESLPLLLDAAAGSVGQRIVRKLDGNTYAVGATTSRTSYDANLLLGKRLAGDILDLIATSTPNDLNASVPDAVVVTFPRTDDGTPSATDYAVTVQLADLALSEYQGAVGFDGTKVFHSTATATYVSAVLTNSAELTALATQIATDYYRFAVPGVDARYGGAVNWDMEGHTDLVEFEHVLDRMSMRVTRGPYHEGMGTALLRHYGSGGSITNVFHGGDVWFRDTHIHFDDSTFTWPTCPSAVLHQEVVRCEQGILRIYRRGVYLSLTSCGGIGRTYGPWAVAGLAGCCDCPTPPDPPDPCVPGVCDVCEDPPYEWTIVVNGFTGHCDSLFNRTWHLEQDDPEVNCEWYEDTEALGVTARVVLTIVGTTATLEFLAGVDGNFTTYAVYEATVSVDCCEELSFALVSCDNCADDTAGADCPGCGDTAPTSWRVAFQGATGCFSSLNGAYTLSQLEGFPCTWQLSSETVVLTLTGTVGSEFFLGVLTVPDGHLAGYRLGVPAQDCCIEQTLSLYHAVCNPDSTPGTAPDMVTLTPSCSSPASSCPDAIQAIAQCCTGTVGDDGSLSGSGGSGGGDVPVECCDVSVPSTLYVTFFGGTGSCSCMDSGPHALEWDGARWIGTATFCGGLQNLILECLFGGSWHLSCVTASVPYCLFGGSATADSCDPLSVSFLNMGNTGNCCDVAETIDAVITEA